MCQARPTRRGRTLVVLVAIAVALALLPAGALGANAVTAGDSPTAGVAQDSLTDDRLVTDAVTNDTSTTDGSTTENATGTVENGTGTLDDGNDSLDGENGSLDDGNSSLDEEGDPLVTDTSTVENGTETLAEGTNGSVSVEGEASLGAGNDTVLDAELNATTDTSGARLSVASMNALIDASVDGSIDSGGERTDSTDDGSNESAGTAVEGSNDGDGGSNGLPDAGDAGAGVAIGSVLVGGGVLASRFLEGSAAAGAAGGGSGGSLLSVAFAWVRAWGWRLLAVLGYQRLDSSDPLEHDTRAGIYERIEDEPGVFLTELSETTDVPMSTLRYHLRILEFEDLIASEKVRGKRRYLPATADADALAPAMEDEATAAVLEAVAAEPDSVSGLADRLDRSPGTVTHHLQRLDDEGLVEREREGRSVVTRLADDVDRTDVVTTAAGHAD